jgi:hypothetical protein
MNGLTILATLLISLVAHEACYAPALLTMITVGTLFWSRSINHKTKASRPSRPLHHLDLGRVVSELTLAQINDIQFTHVYLEGVEHASLEMGQ